MFFKILLILFALFIFFVILLLKNPKFATKLFVNLLSYRNKSHNKKQNTFTKKNNEKVIIEKKSNLNSTLSDYEIIEDKKAKSK